MQIDFYIGASVVFVNGLVAIISKALVKYQKRYTLVNETMFSFNMIMLELLDHKVT